MDENTHLDPDKELDAMGMGDDAPEEVKQQAEEVR